MSDKLEVAIVGLGILGRQYLDFFDRRQDTVIVAVCDVRAEPLNELAARYGTAAFRDLRSPVAAHVQKSPHLSLVVAHDEQRNTAVVIGEVISRLRNSARQAHHQRITAKQNLQLAIQPIGIGVARHGVRGNTLREAGRTCRTGPCGAA